MSELKEGWERLAKAFMLIRNVKTGEKIVVPFNEALKYLISNHNRQWEIVQLLEGEAAKTLYGVKSE